MSSAKQKARTCKTRTPPDGLQATSNDWFSARTHLEKPTELPAPRRGRSCAHGRFGLRARGPRPPEAGGFVEEIMNIGSAPAEGYRTVVSIIMKRIGLRIRLQAGGPDKDVET